MVEYCLLRKAIAPWKIMPPIRCMSLVPGSRRSTSQAMTRAKITATAPATGTIQINSIITSRKARLAEKGEIVNRGVVDWRFFH